MSLLALERVARRYGGHSLFRRRPSVHAVDGVSLSLARGRTLALVGESGCGKSTTGRLALGLEPPDEGRVMFAGAPMPPPGSAAWRQTRARMQMVFQDPLAALDRRLPIAAQVGEPLAIHGIGGRDERAGRVASLLRAVGFPAELGARHPHALSGGQRQRAVIARALASEPELLVCDEPVSALDLSIQAQVVNLLADLQAERGLAMLFISHDLRLVRHIAHEVAVMYLGRIVEQGEADSVFAAASHPYTRALVAAAPEPGRQGLLRPLAGGEAPDPARRPPGCAFHPRCPVALPLCRAESPALLPLPDGRQVACHVVHGETAA